MSIRLSSRWRLALVLAAIGIVVAAVVVVPRLGEDTPTGAPNPHAAVARYVDALNDNDAEALHQLAATSGPALDAAIDRRLDEYGDRRIKLESRDVGSGVASDQVSAVLAGVFDDGRPYEESLTLTRGDDDRWYVDFD